MIIISALIVNRHTTLQNSESTMSFGCSFHALRENEIKNEKRTETERSCPPIEPLDIQEHRVYVYVVRKREIGGNQRNERKA